MSLCCQTTSSSTERHANRHTCTCISSAVGQRPPWANRGVEGSPSSRNKFKSRNHLRRCRRSGPSSPAKPAGKQEGEHVAEPKAEVFVLLRVLCVFPAGRVVLQSNSSSPVKAQFRGRSPPPTDFATSSSQEESMWNKRHQSRESRTTTAQSNCGNHVAIISCPNSSMC